MTSAVTHASDTVGHALLAYAHRTLAEARAPLVATDMTDEVAIRAYRRAMKRWRAFLRLIAPLVGDATAPWYAEARGFARELATARDSRAVLDALATCEAGLPERTRTSVRARLAALGAEAEAGVLTPETRQKLLDGLDRAEAACSGWNFDAIDASQLADRLASGYRRARRAMPADWAAAKAEALHAFRQRVIVHRYQMELMEPAWPKMAHLWVDEAQRLRDRLGRFHDLELLAGLTAPRQPLARWRKPLAAAIAERQARERRGARHIAGRLFAEKPGAFRRRLAALWEHHLS